MSDWQFRFRSLCTVVDIVCEPTAVSDVLRASLATFQQTTDEPHLRYRYETVDEGYRLFRNDAILLTTDSFRRAAMAVEDDIQLQPSEHTDDPYWFLHGAVVVNDLGPICIVGESGAGKSTLTLELLKSGCRYFTDEAFGISVDEPIVSFRRPLCLKRWPDDLPPGFSAANHPVFTREESDTRVLVSVPPEQLADEALGTPLLLHLKPDPAEGAEPHVLSLGVALSSLWPSTFNLRPSTLTRATALLRQHPVYEQRRMPIAQALETVLALQQQVVGG